MLYVIVSLVILLADRGLKYWVSVNIPIKATGTDCVTVLPKVLRLTDVQNEGAAFSILQGQRWLFVAVTVVFVVAVIFLLNREIINGSFGRWMLVLVLAGAVGNGIDRAVYGYVIDMFEVLFIRFPVFNIADIFITVGGLLFCVYIFVHKEPWEQKPARAATGEPATDEFGGGFMTRRRKTAETPYDLVPKRGEHKVEKLRPDDADNPFAEWEVSLEETAEAPAPEEPEDLQRSLFDPEDEGPEEAPAPTETGAAAPAAEDDFSLDDILAEFGIRDT